MPDNRNTICRVGQENRIVIISFLVCIIILFFASCTNNYKSFGNQEDTHTKPSIQLEWKVGDVYTDKNGWTEVIVGNMPLIISVPHGGDKNPDFIEDRTCSGAVTTRDLNTVELSYRLKEQIEKTTEKTPYMILSHISRKKIDQNRNLKEATCGNLKLEPVWEYYHQSLDSIISKSIEHFGYALFVEVHGHAHPIERIELGYALSKDELIRLNESNPDDELRISSSLDGLLKLQSSLNLKEMIIGEYSFGTIITDESYNAVPAKQDPYVNKEDKYFTGGYNTRRYTNPKNYPGVFGFQMECPRLGIREDSQTQHLFAQSFVQAYKKYIKNIIDL